MQQIARCIRVLFGLIDKKKRLFLLAFLVVTTQGCLVENADTLFTAPQMFGGFSNDCSKIITGPDVTIRSTVSGDILRSFALNGKARFTPEGTGLFVSEIREIQESGAKVEINEVIIADIDSGETLRTFPGFYGDISTDGKYVYTEGNDSTNVVKCWDANTGVLVRQIDIGSAVQQSKLLISGDSSRLCLGNYRVLDVTNGNQLFYLNYYFGETAISPDFRYLAFSNGADETDLMGRIEHNFEAPCIRDIVSGAQISLDLPDSVGPPFYLRFSKDSSALLISGGGFVQASAPLHGLTTASLWDVKSGKKIRSFYDLVLIMRSLVFFPQPHHPIISDDKSKVAVLEYIVHPADQQRDNLPLNERYCAKVWDTATGRITHNLGPVIPIAFSPDSNMVAAFPIDIQSTEYIYSDSDIFKSGKVSVFDLSTS